MGNAQAAIFAFSGHLTRKQFAAFSLLGLAIVILVIALGAVVGSNFPDSPTVNWLMVAFTFGSAGWITLALVTKRTRDIGWPPYLGAVALVLLAAAPFLRGIILSDATIEVYTRAAIATALGAVGELGTIGLILVMTTVRSGTPRKVEGDQGGQLGTIP